MSIEAAKSFIERMKTDEDFRKKVSECKDNEVRKAFVEKEGYNFTEEDINALRVSLTDDDLQSISAGTTGYCFIFDTGQHPY